MAVGSPREADTGAEALLKGLRASGIRYMFSNSGTDFPPIIEALATLPPDSRPEAVLVPHETAAVGMAHGYYLATGAPQAVMVHVNVGLANSVMGLINAASDNIPVVMLSGRTPITEGGRPGGRVTPIQYGQEMYDQSAMVAELTKFRYEMRYPEQGASLPVRATALARSAPEGPVYLSLPREPLMERLPDGAPEVGSQSPARAPAPDAEAIRILSDWVAAARSPVIICQRSDVAGRAAAALDALSRRHAIGVVEPFPVRNVLASDHPAHMGHDPGTALSEADLVIVLDSGVPWIAARHAPAPDARVVHIGPDPHFARMPVRGYRTDMAIAADPACALDSLAAALPEPGPEIRTRSDRLAFAAAARRQDAADEAAQGAGAPMSAEWLSHCLSEVLDPQAMVFSELGVVPGAMRLKGPNQLFVNPHSGGLGWSLPAALGAQLADRTRLVVACLGDGSYMFANPVACHQVAEALELPVLTIIKNNAMWNAVRRAVVGSFPEGAAMRANTMPLTSLTPVPDFLKVAEASRAYAERIENGADLPAALARAVEVIRGERRHVVLEVRTALSDRH